ncbi:MAG: DUF4476 domain-containing protein [Chitinophagales bacterium]
MKQFLFLLSLLIGVSCYAQENIEANVAIFGLDEYPYHVKVNGIRVSSEYKTTYNLLYSKGEYKLHIDFKDEEIPLIENVLKIEDNDSISLLIRNVDDSLFLVETSKTSSLFEKDIKKGQASLKVDEFDKSEVQVSINTNAEIKDETEEEEEIHDINLNSISEKTVVSDFEIESNPVKEKVSTCKTPIEQQEFKDLVKFLKDKEQDLSKYNMAKLTIDHNCMTTTQISEVLNQFSEDDTRLDFAKKAYSKCTDPQNYWKIAQAFSDEEIFNELIYSLD